MFEWSLTTVWYQVLHREYYKAEYQKAECGGGIMFFIENIMKQSVVVVACFTSRIF